MRLNENHSEKFISEKDFSKKFFCSVSMVVLSLICLTVSAWAMFGDSVENIKQNVTASNFCVDALIEKDGAEYIPAEGNVFEAGKYDITLTAKGSVSERSGFCKIMIGDTLVRYTPQMRTQEQKENNILDAGYPETVKFTVELKKDAVIKFISSWSTYTDEKKSLSLKEEDGIYETIIYDCEPPQTEQREETSVQTENEEQTEITTQTVTEKLTETAEVQTTEETKKLRRQIKKNINEEK